MAEGQSNGGAPKLLADIDGHPLIGHAATVAARSKAGSVIVVTGHQAPEIAAAALDACPAAHIIYNSDFRNGMASSLRCGLGAVPPDHHGAAILLGDMPGLRVEHLNMLIEAFGRGHCRAIVAPTCQGRRGNPVLWPRDLFPDLAAVQGDQGGREVLKHHADRLVTVPMDGTGDGGTGVLADIDTAEALAAWRAARKRDADGR